jgi:hypothetical protein
MKQRLLLHLMVILQTSSDFRLLSIVKMIDIVRLTTTISLQAGEIEQGNLGLTDKRSIDICLTKMANGQTT